MNKTESVDYLKSQGRCVSLVDGVVMVTSDKGGKAAEKEFKGMRKELNDLGFNGSIGIRIKEQVEEHEISV